MKYVPAIAISAVAALFAGTVLAATTSTMRDLPNGENVTLNGTVENFSNQHSFTLRDPSGTVTVDLSSTKPLVLTEGEPVAVVGTVHHTILGTDLVASDVTEKKGMGERVGSALDALMGNDVASNAQPVNIGALPKSGLVKVDGVVDNVETGKRFTIKDSTGHVDVSIKSGESASLDKGTEVQVVGNVDHGLLGTRIYATKIDVVSDNSSVSEQ